MQAWYHCENTYPFVPQHVLDAADSVRASLPNKYCDPKIAAQLFEECLDEQLYCDELGVNIEVHHFPPGTSKWNKIEHRLFSFITMNWRARPLVSFQVIVDLIASTTTETRLKVLCELDSSAYPKGVVVIDEQMASLNMTRAEFHGEWNYTIKPRSKPNEATVS